MVILVTALDIGLTQRDHRRRHMTSRTKREIDDEETNDFNRHLLFALDVMLISLLRCIN